MTPQNTQTQTDSSTVTEDVLTQQSVPTAPDWLTSEAKAELTDLRTTLRADLTELAADPTGQNLATVDNVTIGDFPAVRVAVTNGGLSEDSPLMQPLQDYNAHPIAPQIRASGVLKFDAIPTPPLRIGMVSRLQQHNTAPNQTYTLTLSKALDRAGFSIGDEVSHYSRPGEIKLTTTQTPFSDAQPIGSPCNIEAAPDNDYVKASLKSVANEVQTRGTEYRPEIVVTTTDEELGDVINAAVALPVEIVGIVPISTPGGTGQTVQVRLQRQPTFSDLATTTTIRKRNDSAVTTLTYPARHANFVDDPGDRCSDAPLPRLGVYARPGEIRIARAATPAKRSHDIGTK